MNINQITLPDLGHLEQSQTLRKLSVLSNASSINASDKAAVDSALATALIGLVAALDQESIQFHDRESRDAFWHLLLVAYQVVTQIRPVSLTAH